MWQLLPPARRLAWQVGSAFWGRDPANGSADGAHAVADPLASGTSAVAGPAPRAPRKPVGTTSRACDGNIILLALAQPLAAGSEPALAMALAPEPIRAAARIGADATVADPHANRLDDQALDPLAIL